MTLDLPNLLDSAAGRVVDFLKADTERTVALEKVRADRAVATAAIAAGQSRPLGGSIDLARYVPYVIGGVLLLVLVKAVGGRR